MDDGVDRVEDVGGLVDHDRGVTGADAEGGLAGGVGGLDHARATGGQDDVNVAHELARELEGGLIDPADDALGRAGLDGGLVDDLGGRDGALGCRGVRRDDDGVAGLQADEGLEDRGRSGVSGRDDRAHDADRLGDLGDAVGLVMLEHAAGLGVLISVVDVLGRVVVLDDLILEDAALGLLDGHLGQRDALLVGCHGRLEEDLVDLLLRVGRENRLRAAHVGQLGLERIDGVDDLGDGRCRCLFHHVSLLVTGDLPYIRNSSKI